LARMLAENAGGNLAPKQVKSAETIHSSGTDLLALINDILDLSKIESGKMDVDIGNVRFSELEDYVSRTFRHVAEGKTLDLTIDVDPLLSLEVIRTDAKRLQQVLKNLLSNALKFTAQGTVRLRMERATVGWSLAHPVLTKAKSVIAFSVIDSGIGIPHEKQRIIFEAFQQADGTTSRKYGGTGLGLSISRELARLLGGEIRLQSAINRGSTFTLYLPQVYVSAVPKFDIPAAIHAREANPLLPASTHMDMILPVPMETVPAEIVEEDLVIDDDRDTITPDDRVLLIVEDDVTFARILADLARQSGLKALVALRGVAALSLVREFKPSVITLDVRLPDMSGWTLLDRLKHEPATRHIPVHVISAHESTSRGFTLGAASCLAKEDVADSITDAFSIVLRSLPRGGKTLILACADEARREQAHKLLDGPNLEVIDVPADMDIALAARQHEVDGIAIDVALPGVDAAEIAAAVQKRLSPNVPPIILFGSRKLPEAQADRLERLGRNSSVHHAPSLERLLADMVLALNRKEADLSQEQKRIIADVNQTDPMLAGK
ncbi:MAG: ATP-binding protein, partial [Acidobacteria bacterium]|nr:ATP-binding protein [Acidobacteriota bacterium]